MFNPAMKYCVLPDPVHISSIARRLFRVWAPQSHLQKQFSPLPLLITYKRSSQSLAGGGKILGYGEQPGAALRLVRRLTSATSRGFETRRLRGWNGWFSLRKPSCWAVVSILSPWMWRDSASRMNHPHRDIVLANGILAWNTLVNVAWLHSGSVRVFWLRLLKYCSNSAVEGLTDD
jgi:hypothetical protein